MKDGAFAPQSWKFPGFCEWEIKKEEKKSCLNPFQCLTSHVVWSKTHWSSCSLVVKKAAAAGPVVKDSIVPGFTAPRQAGGWPELGEHPDQRHLLEQDTSDKTMLRQIITFSDSRADSSFDNKIQLVYCKR